MRVIDGIINNFVDLSHKREKDLKSPISNYYQFIEYYSFFKNDNIYVDTTVSSQLYDDWLKKVKIPDRDYCDNMIVNLLVIIGNRDYEMLNNGDGNMHDKLSDGGNPFKAQKKIKGIVKRKFGFNMPLYYNFSSTHAKYYKFQRNYERLVDYIEDNNINLRYNRNISEEGILKL
jgi:hypothetical protein